MEKIKNITASYYLVHLSRQYRILIMAKCNICGKRTWFFLYHKCHSRLTVVNSRSPSISASVKSTPLDDLNFQFQQQKDDFLQKISVIESFGSDDSCRSAPTEPSYSHHQSSNSSSHCHDSSSSYSSDSSSSTSDSGSSRSS